LRAERHRPFAVRILPLGGEDDHRGVAAVRHLLHLLEDIEAADVGHHDVEQHEVDRDVAAEYLEGFAAVGDAGHVIWSALELELDDPADVRLVVRDEDPAAGGGLGSVRKAPGIRHRQRSSTRRVRSLRRSRRRGAKPTPERRRATSSSSGERFTTMATPLLNSRAALTKSPCSVAAPRAPAAAARPGMRAATVSASRAAPVCWITRPSAPRRISWVTPS